MKKLILVLLGLCMGCQGSSTKDSEISEFSIIYKELGEILPQEKLEGEKWVKAVKMIRTDPLDKEKIKTKEYAKKMSGRDMKIIEYYYEGEMLGVWGEGEIGVRPLPDLKYEQIKEITYGSEKHTSFKITAQEQIRKFHDVLSQESTNSFTYGIVREILVSGKKSELCGWASGGNRSFSQWKGFTIHLEDGSSIKIQGPNGRNYLIREPKFCGFMNSNLFSILSPSNKQKRALE